MKITNAQRFYTCPIVLIIAEENKFPRRIYFDVLNHPFMFDLPYNFLAFDVKSIDIEPCADNQRILMHLQGLNRVLERLQNVRGKFLNRNQIPVVQSKIMTGFTGYRGFNTPINFLSLQEIIAFINLDFKCLFLSWDKRMPFTCNKPLFPNMLAKGDNIFTNLSTLGSLIGDG